MTTMGVVLFLLLSCLGFAVNVQAQNCSRPQPGPNMHIKGNDILLEMFPERARVYFTCDVGYQSAGGSAFITCYAGNWAPVRLTCEKKNCGSVGEVANAVIEYHESSEFGDKAKITCNPGYRLVGKDEMTCEDEGWSGRLPECEEVACEPPPPIVDGTFNPVNDVYSYRDAVQYSCKKDYTLIGRKSRVCSEDGTFKPEAPTCVLVACEEPSVDYADWIRRPPYRLWSMVTFHCRSGYTVKGEETQTCNINSQWSPGLPTCEPKNCSRPVPGPNMILTGSNSQLQTFLHGTTVSFACDVGYMSAGGSEVITCSFGSWSHVTLKCQKRNCGSAGEVSNGRVVYPKGTEFGDKAVITCNTGYKLVGQGEIICGDQGWSGRLPECQVVTCGPAPQIVDGTINNLKKVYKYTDVVLYTCNDGYTLFGSTLITCSEDGTFKPDAPTCALIECEEPFVDSADWTRKPPYRPGSMVRVHCRSGHILKGEETQTCGKDGRWSPGLPTCQSIQCEEPFVANADSPLDSQGPYEMSSVVTVKCRSGYILKGEEKQTCGKDGRWSPGLPTCEETGNPWFIPFLCFVAGFLAGVLFTLVGISVKKRRSWKNNHKKEPNKEEARELKRFS